MSPAKVAAPSTAIDITRYERLARENDDGHLNLPVYDVTSRLERGGPTTITCPFSGPTWEGYPMGQNVELGATIAGKFDQKEYNAQEQSRYLNNLEITYVVEPFGDHVKEDAALIVIMEEESGINYDARILCNQFAAAGYLVVMPHYRGKREPLRGAADDEKDLLVPDPDTIQMGRLDESDAVQKSQVATAVLYLTNYRKRTRIGGLAFGSASTLLEFMEDAPPARGRIRLTHINPKENYDSLVHNSTKKIKAGFVCHIRREEAIYFDPQRVRGSTQTYGPISLAVGEERENQSMIAYETEYNLIRTYLRASNQPYQFVRYGQVSGDFGVRRPHSENTKEEISAKRQAFVQAITFMEEWL
ncbi:hypothetical protein HYALB_00007891 [Hymenoscyphus albidus]|uniref:Dienelactone hydrolase domain-containing protein n=1 Tax=Hymenoscyphus albidus TaxID=595503 RepID=A0A9N9LMC0_9HELO|nr:hypothetical protein HYALB_00007891 [Hymenoscyphus albidus]